MNGFTLLRHKMQRKNTKRNKATIKITAIFQIPLIL